MWSKKATGRCGKTLSVQAKLKLPKPTPSQGCAAISDSVLAQIAKRELEMSPSAASRSSAPNTWWPTCAHAARPTQATA